jgi:hypothetical protein
MTTGEALAFTKTALQSHTNIYCNITLDIFSQQNYQKPHQKQINDFLSRIEMVVILAQCNHPTRKNCIETKNKN